ncbi:hypothetical protein F5B22DRAFT_440722 [Xylaria bambusicola]|uniref:uncharacterized protein n=1 Tax=Xylaria bambusicola TaxID=326684 RepID=UPI002008835E|nr:uncharacterized protein F5B22DRAFT_440722 [Xylaria bambusicola]KAI0506703.1 hypothetical protein F5B22DRAFT_440722 [Xylaria bambusicola]
MRLLQRDNAGHYSLTPDLTPDDDIPPYAILSHTWGPDEVLFTDLTNAQNRWHQKAGYAKIQFCAKQATRHGLQYFWVDSCCIDKLDSIELQTAINSMFRWYRNAKICYVYLSDVSSPTAISTQDGVAAWEAAFQDSRWFTHGWTLQELIAPNAVEFYSKEGTWLGDKQSLEPQLRDITRIPARALRGAPLSDFTVAEREAWARGRQTKYEEDMAYSLLGIFDVHMPLIYGEGRQNAQKRLREEVEKAIRDFSITFSLSDVPETQHFVARTREINEMRKALASDGSRRVVVLHGLGGIGKTQIAIVYAKRYRDEYSAIFWLNIKDETSIRQSFTKVAGQILLQHPNASHLRALDLQQDQEKVVEAVKAWLSLPGNTRWLLVYDNYDNPKLSNDINDRGINISRFIPEAYQGSIIVTTRLLQVDLGHQVQVKKLESLHDSLKILATTSGRDGLDTDIGAKRLIEELDGLPLALATAGAYLRRVPIGLANYLRLYKESWLRVHTDTPNLGSYQDRTLCSTWQLSYVQVQKQHPLAAHLLRWWAYFSNEDIWFELLQTDNTDGPVWIHELADELNFNQAIGALHNYGFVEPYISASDSVGSRGYSMHACVHSWTVSVLNKDPEDSLARATVTCVAAKVPSQDEHQFWSFQNRLLSHAECCVMRLDSDDGIEWAFHSLGNLFRSQGKLAEAEAMYIRALQGYEKAWGPEHPSTLDTVNNLGLLYKDQSKLAKAEAMYIRALQGYEKAWGPEHPSTLDIVNNLGVLYKNQGKLAEAEAMYIRALQGYQKAIGPQNIVRYRPAIGTSYNLGSLLYTQGKQNEAKSLLRQVHVNLEALLGPLHKDVQSLQNALQYMNQLQ